MNRVTGRSTSRLNAQSLDVLDGLCRKHHEWIKQRAWAACERLARALKGGTEMRRISVILRSLRFLQEFLGELIALEQLCDCLKRGRR